MHPFIIMVVVLFGLIAPHASAADGECKVPPTTWRSVAPGIDNAEMSFPGPSAINDLSLFRFDPAVFEFRVFDMRDLPRRNQERQIYTPPLYSLLDVLRISPSAVAVTSAGLTKSLTDPIPAGLLKVQRQQRSPSAPSDPFVNGVVCFQDNSISILSVIEDGKRRAPANVQSCAEGFQAGPVLMARSTPEAASSKLEAPRVLMAVDRQRRAVVGFSSRATLSALACALSADQLGIIDAINVQGGGIGGIAFNKSATGSLPNRQLGDVRSTLASALIIVPRGMPRKR